MAKSPLVTTGWLNDRLYDANIKIIDGSLHMPSANRDAPAEFESGHIPGSVFFDIDAHSDPAAKAPHTLMSARDFADVVRSLGISSDDTIVIYDDSDFRTGARVWWNFQVMGHRQVYILDGGLAKWRAEGLATEAGHASPTPSTEFTPNFDTSQYRTAANILAVIASGAEQIVDARAAERFDGTAPEPRPGMRSGHIPTALNLPFSQLFGPDGTMLDNQALLATIEAAGIDMARPIVTSCGSGVTACVLKLAFSKLGKDDVAIYDGSWSEWANNPDHPIETGTAV